MEKLSYSRVLEELIKGEVVGSFDYHGLIKLRNGVLYVNNNRDLSDDSWEVLYSEKEDIEVFLKQLYEGLEIRRDEVYRKEDDFKAHYRDFVKQLKY